MRVHTDHKSSEEHAERNETAKNNSIWNPRHDHHKWSE